MNAVVHSLLSPSGNDRFTSVSVVLENKHFFVSITHRGIVYTHCFSAAMLCASEMTRSLRSPFFFIFDCVFESSFCYFHTSLIAVTICECREATQISVLQSRFKETQK